MGGGRHSSFGGDSRSGQPGSKQARCAVLVPPRPRIHQLDQRAFPWKRRTDPPRGLLTVRKISGFSANWLALSRTQRTMPNNLFEPQSPEIKQLSMGRKSSDSPLAETLRPTWRRRGMGMGNGQWRWGWEWEMGNGFVLNGSPGKMGLGDGHGAWKRVHFEIEPGPSNRLRRPNKREPITAAQLRAAFR